MLEIRPNQGLEITRRKIAERIRPVCADMPEDEFETLVTRMALIEWKHARETNSTSRLAG